MTAFYMARQPILDAQGSTFGYELLFRSTEKNAYDPTVGGDAATARLLINTIVEAGLDSIVGDKKAFINLTQHFLESPEMLDLIVPGRCVLEVLEDVEVTDQVLSGVEALRAKGHTIALDDFVDAEQFERLLPLAHIIKYDITEHTMDALADYRRSDEQAGRLSLVERVETQDEFNELLAAGFHYFQGYYFAKPAMLSGTTLPSNKIAVLQLLAQMNDSSLGIDELADTLSRDISLSVRTLKYVNSPLNGLYNEVTSIRHAVSLLGLERIRNWVNLLVVSGMDDKPSELTKMALTRARFCQLMAGHQAHQDDAMYFTIGLLSLLGAMMDIELGAALEQVSLNDDMRDQIINRSGPGGQMLDLVVRLESPESDLVSVDTVVGPFYQEAITWTEKTVQML